MRNDDYISIDLSWQMGIIPFPPPQWLVNLTLNSNLQLFFNLSKIKFWIEVLGHIISFNQELSAAVNIVAKNIIYGVNLTINIQGNTKYLLCVIFCNICNHLAIKNDKYMKNKSTWFFLTLMYRVILNE